MSSHKITVFRTVSIIICIIVALALIYVNSVPNEIYKRSFRYQEGNIIPGIYIPFTGWPIFYSGEWQYNLRGIFTNIFLAIILLIATYVCMNKLLYILFKKKQFGISDICVLTISTALCCSLLSTEKFYGEKFLSNLADIGFYSSLSAFPVLVIIPISIGIICSFYLMVMAMIQIISGLINKLFAKPKTNNHNE
jgi:hypothetical protein